jgi:hypothetical protein
MNGRFGPGWFAKIRAIRSVFKSEESDTKGASTSAPFRNLLCRISNRVLPATIRLKRRPWQIRSGHEPGYFVRSILYVRSC